MEAEQTFRTIVLISVAVFLPIGIYHRLKSQATRERLDRRQEGVVMLISLRLCGLLTWIVGLIRFRGHFPKGGYDVHDGQPNREPATPPAV